MNKRRKILRTITASLPLFLALLSWPSQVMGLGVVSATRKALERAGLTIADIDIAEINEAFAVIALVAIRELGLAGEKVNPNGGAVALGHPMGCTGARLVTTLLHEMVRRRVRYGLATMCVGMGQGAAWTRAARNDPTRGSDAN